jgi:hypothetical protein
MRAAINHFKKTRDAAYGLTAVPAQTTSHYDASAGRAARNDKGKVVALSQSTLALRR